MACSPPSTLPNKLLLDLALPLQAPQREAVVATVGRAQQRVDVEALRLLVGEEDARVVVELDDDDGALEAEVEGIRGAVAADPREVGLAVPGAAVVELEPPRADG